MTYQLNKLPVLQTGDYEVLLIDAWKTLFRGPYPEPPGDTQQILQYKCKMTPDGPKVDQVDPEFLHVCLTTNIEDPAEFLEFLARRFDLPRPDRDQHERFLALVQSEKKGLCTFLDVEDELRELRNMGYRLGLLSNVWPFPIKYLLRRAKLDSYFEHLILSYEVGYAKPQPQIFDCAVRKFGVSKRRCLMIGDNLTLDIQGALEYGIDAVHIDRYPHEPARRLPGVPVIGELGELYRAQID